MIDIWNITYGDEVSEDPRVGQHCLMNMNGGSKGTVYKIYVIYKLYTL